MSEKFNLEIISPDQTLLSTDVKQVIIPAYEGMMTILKNHISLITFLRPGFIEVEIENKIEKFYVEEGTVEFFNNKLLILTSSTIKLDKLTTANQESDLLVLRNSNQERKDNLMNSSYRCDFCDKLFQEKIQFHKHIKVHYCDRCNLKFDFKAHLIVYINCIHKETKDNSCEQCNLKCEFEQNFKRRVDVILKEQTILVTNII